MKIYEDVFCLPGLSVCERQTGFRGLDNVTIPAYERERDPLILISLYYDTHINDLFWDGRVSASYLDMSDEAKRYILENTWLGEAVLDCLWEELPDDWIVDDYDSYEEWERNVLDYFDPTMAVSPHGVVLDTCHPDFYDDWVEGIEFDNGSFKHVAARHIIEEFDAILEKHGLVKHMLDWFMQTIQKQDNP